MSTAMNERKIIDRKYLCDLAKEVGLTTLDLEALGENHHWEIVVEGNLLERMIETQRQFERLAVIGDEEYRGFYIEVPRPTSEDWGNAEELIASGEYSSMDAYLSDWLAFNPMETRWFYVTSRKHGNLPTLLFLTAPRIMKRSSMMFVARRTLHVFSTF